MRYIIVFALAAALAGCGSQHAGSAPSATPSTTTGLSDANFDRAVFTPSMVRFTVRTKRGVGGQIQAFYVIGSRPALASAKKCVEHYLRYAKAAFCWGFRSSQALRAAHIDRRHGGMKRLCWKARWGHAIDGSEDGSRNGPLDIGCP